MSEFSLFFSFCIWVLNVTWNNWVQCKNAFLIARTNITQMLHNVPTWWNDPNKYATFRVFPTCFAVYLSILFIIINHNLNNKCLNWKKITHVRLKRLRCCLISSSLAGYVYLLQSVGGAFLRVGGRVDFALSFATLFIRGATYAVKK